jgi:hypothetical protein
MKMFTANALIAIGVPIFIGLAAGSIFIIAFIRLLRSKISSDGRAPPKPLDIRAAPWRGHSSLTHEARPVGKSVRGTRQALRQAKEQIRPWLRVRRKTRRHTRDVEQDRLNSFHYRESGQSNRVGGWGTQQLSSRPDKRRIVGVLAETQSDRDLLIAQLRIVGREIRREIAFIVAGAAADGTSEQPLADTILWTTAHLADFMQQRRHTGGLAEPSGQR